MIAWNWGVLKSEAILSLGEPPEFIPYVSFAALSTGILVGTAWCQLLPLHPPSLSSPCTKLILITCCIQILVTCCIRILVTCCIRILVTCCIRILVTCLFESSSHVYLNPRHMLYYNLSVTISTRNPSWPRTDTIFFSSISAASHRPECQIQQSSPARPFEEWPSPSPQGQSSSQWQRFFITAEPLVVVYPLLEPGSGGVRWCYGLSV